jgi:hypothetical protein
MVLNINTGGWNPTPKLYKRNTLITGAIILSLTAVVWNISIEKERRVHYPHRWIPSMLWAKEFHVLLSYKGPRIYSKMESSIKGRGKGMD